MRKMTARELERKIHKGITKHNLYLSHYGYKCGSAVCAIGGALAYHAKSREELEILLYQDPAHRESGHTRARVAAKILNHNLSPRDMVMLEMGFELYTCTDYATPDANKGDRVHVEDIRQNPFYRLGRKLRAESMRRRKTA